MINRNVGETETFMIGPEPSVNVTVVYFQNYYIGIGKSLLVDNGVDAIILSEKTMQAILKWANNSQA